MTPTLIPMNDPDPTLLAWVAEHLTAGGLVAYPTETVYGFGGLARSDAVARLEALKPRDGKSGFLVLVRDREAAAGLHWTPVAQRLADTFWPGPLTLVLDDPDRTQPDGVRSRTGTVAVRVSPNPLAAALVAALELPLTSTSANAPGVPPALDARGALDAAETLGARNALWVLDGGALPPGPSSTMLDVSGPMPRVLRRGAISVERLRTLIPDLHD